MPRSILRVMSGDSFNFTSDVVERLARERPGDEALRTIAAGRCRALAAPSRTSRGRPPVPQAGWRPPGSGAGDVVMTLMGARAEWVFAMLGAWRLGAVALPCSEQLRAKDIALRLERTQPALVLPPAPTSPSWSGRCADAERPPRWIDVDADGAAVRSDATCRRSTPRRQTRR